MTTTGRHFLPLFYGINLVHSADSPRARRKTHMCEDKVNVLSMIPARFLRPSVSFQNSTSFFSCSLCSIFVSFSYLNFTLHKNLTGRYAVAQLVEALRYKPDGRGFDSRWCHNPSGRTVAMRSTQPLTEISIRCLHGYTVHQRYQNLL